MLQNPQRQAARPELRSSDGAVSSRLSRQETHEWGRDEHCVGLPLLFLK